MNGFVAALDRRKNVVPFALDVGAIGVEPGLEAGFGQNTLALGDFPRNRDANSDRNNAQISYDFHGFLQAGSDQSRFFKAAIRALAFSISCSPGPSEAINASYSRIASRYLPCRS